MSPKSRGRRRPSARAGRSARTSSSSLPAAPPVRPPASDPAPGEPAEPALALPALREVYAAYVREAAALLQDDGALTAELRVSSALGRLHAAAPHAEGHRLALADLMLTMERAATPGAAAFLRTFAVIGPRALRSPADRAAERLAAAGIAAPGWTERLGDVRPGDVASIQDGTLDREQIVCEFRYADGGGHHALAVRLEQGLPVEVIVIGDVPGMMAQVRKAVEAEECVLMRADRVTAAGRLRAAFDAAVAPSGHDAQDGPAWRDEEWYDLLAFASHRIEVAAGR